MKMLKPLLLATVVCFSLFAKSRQYDIEYSADEIRIDGKAETIWQTANWQSITNLWDGEEASKNDFSGRYKVLWREEAIYLLVEVIDDCLVDLYTNALEKWPNDDCVEIFVDGDASGGEHTFNNNAFAYHVATNFAVVDITQKYKGILYNSHIKSARMVTNNVYTWEFAVGVYSSNAIGINDTPITLHEGKVIGFAVAYCDSDGSGKREHFYGSEIIEGENKNVAWQNADVFAKVVLKKREE